MSERLACTSDHIHVLIAIELSLPEERRFVSAIFTEKVHPYSIRSRIDGALEALAECLKAFQVVEIHLENTILRSVAEIFKDFRNFGPTLIVTNVVSYHVKHCHTSESG